MTDITPADTFRLLSAAIDDAVRTLAGLAEQAVFATHPDLLEASVATAAHTGFQAGATYEHVSDSKVILFRCTALSPAPEGADPEAGWTTVAFGFSIEQGSPWRPAVIPVEAWSWGWRVVPPLGDA